MHQEQMESTIEDLKTLLNDEILDMGLPRNCLVERSNGRVLSNGHDSVLKLTVAPTFYTTLNALGLHILNIQNTEQISRPGIAHVFMECLEPIVKSLGFDYMIADPVKDRDVSRNLWKDLGYIQDPDKRTAWIKSLKD